MELPLLTGLPEEEVRRVVSVGRRRRFGRGEVVFHRDDPADTLHLIVKGHFAVRVVTPLGETAILTILGRGDSFGELALVSATPARRSATVSALEEGETLSIHQVDFDGLIKRHPELREVLIRVLAAQVQRLSGHLVEALYVPADRRVLRRLREVSALYADGADGAVEVPLNQEDLAGLAGTSRATVNKVLRTEEERGTVRLSRGRTTILDADALARRAG